MRKFESKNIFYKKWLKTGLLDDLEISDKLKLATYLTESFEVMDIDLEIDDNFNKPEDSMFPIIIRRMFIEGNIDLNVKEIYNNVNKFYKTLRYNELNEGWKVNSYQYQRCGSCIDVESNIISYICENYEKIKKNEN